MWKIAFKQILAYRRSNLWLLAELFLVSIILWYCIDFLSVMIYKRYMEPTGINTDHVYELRVERAPDYRITQNMLDSLDTYWVEPQLQIRKVLADHPSIESAAYYFGTRPYTNLYMSQGYSIDGESYILAPIRYVSKEYFDVLKIDLIAGEADPWSIDFPQSAIVSPQFADSLFHSRDIIGKSFYDYFFQSLESVQYNYIVAGICPPTKSDYFQEYEPFIYTPLVDTRLRYQLVTYLFRVKPEADHRGFAREFFDEMRSTLEIGPFYLTDVKPVSDFRDFYLTSISAPKYQSIIGGLVAFFIFIVFLGVLGTYWFMIERRRSEIGIRMALGSSRADINAFLMRESFILLLMAYFPALIISATLAYFDITYTFQNCMPYTWTRFWITQVINFATLLIVLMLGALIPAHRASKLNPTAILNEE